MVLVRTLGTSSWGVHAHHFLRTDLPIPLDIPEAKCTHRGRDRLSETQIGIFKEAEREFIVLAYRHQCPRGVESLHTPVM